MPTTLLALEIYYQKPEESYHLFLARAWKLDESAHDLDSHFDLPWMKRGDLFHIH